MPVFHILYALGRLGFWGPCDVKWSRRFLTVIILFSYLFFFFFLMSSSAIRLSTLWLASTCALERADGFLAESFHIPGGHVHRQFGADRERRPDPLQPRIRFPEHDSHSQNHAGSFNLIWLFCLILFPTVLFYVFQFSRRQFFFPFFVSNFIKMMEFVRRLAPGISMTNCSFCIHQFTNRKIMESHSQIVFFLYMSDSRRQSLPIPN